METCRLYLLCFVCLFILFILSPKLFVHFKVMSAPLVRKSLALCWAATRRLPSCHLLTTVHISWIVCDHILLLPINWFLIAVTRH